MPSMGLLSNVNLDFKTEKWAADKNLDIIKIQMVVRAMRLDEIIREIRQILKKEREREIQGLVNGKKGGTFKKPDMNNKQEVQ